LVVALLPEALGVQGHGVVVIDRRVVEEGVHDVLLHDLSLFLSNVLLVRRTFANGGGVR